MPLRLFLVRHGESVDNVAGLLAGTRDSPLTSHGVLQARRLGAHLAARFSSIGPIKAVFASNLQRAVKTAEAIAEAQSGVDGAGKPVITQLPELKEKDFGSEEGMRFGKRGSSQHNGATGSSSAGYLAPEGQEAMRVRVGRFVGGALVPALIAAMSDPDDAGGYGSIVVVAHGIILNVLLRCLLTRWGPDEIARLPSAGDVPWRKEWLAAWSNTGYLEAEVRMATPVVVAGSARVGCPPAEQGHVAGSYEAESPSVEAASGSTLSEDAAPVDQPPLPVAVLPSSSASASSPALAYVPADVQLSVKRVNCVEHLQGLKKTRGGIGSAGFDEKQKTMESFFSRPAKKLKGEDGSG